MLLVLLARSLQQQSLKLVQYHLPHELLQAHCMAVGAQRACRHLVVELLPAPNRSGERCLFDI